MSRAQHLDQLMEEEAAIAEKGASLPRLTKPAHGEAPPRELPLFRPEAMNQLREKPYGEIVLLRPVALSLLVWLALGFIAAIICFLVTGRYTNKAHISGVLLPDRGLIKLYAPQAGTLLACHAHEGQQVRAGAVVFELSSDRSSLAFGSMETEIHDELLDRRQSLVEERADTLKLNLQQQTWIESRLANTREEEAHLALETAAAERKLALAEQMLDKYRQLRKADLISPLQLEEKEGEPLEQQKALEELRRSQVAAESERRDLQSQMQKIPLQTQLAIAAVERNIHELDGQLSEHEASRAAVVRAACDGTLYDVIDKIGVMVQPGMALAALVPAGSRLEAHLYAPSRDIGFVQPGEKVVLRYQAYPAEKFGQHTGMVAQVSQVALTPNEYASRTDGVAREPMYEIIVALPTQAMILYGQPHPLKTGMAVDADIHLEHRRLIEWIFEPLLNLRGRLTP